jgi:hypothetical protein
MFCFRRLPSRSLLTLAAFFSLGHLDSRFERVTLGPTIKLFEAVSVPRLQCNIWSRASSFQSICLAFVLHPSHYETYMADREETMGIGEPFGEKRSP